MENPLAQFDHPAWFTAIGTLVGYGLVLLVLFAVLFVLPLAIFVALG
jgi:hypothetical protein